MAETLHFAAPLLEAAQAQKHVTVNEALLRLDALAAHRVQGLFATQPPAGRPDGEVWGVGPGATGAWAGRDGTLAVASGGGWIHVAPGEGQRVLDAGTGTWWMWDGAAWVEGVVARSPGGATVLARVAEIDHAVGTGATSETAAFIPDKAVVIGVSARVVSAIGGATGWALGVAGSADRYGSGFGVAAGSWAEGVTSEPIAYYGGSSLLMTASGGSFSGGTVRLAAHYLGIGRPAA